MKKVILTNEMIINNETFDITEYPSCKFFLPFTETSGNTGTDLVTGAVINFAVQIDGSAGASPIFDGIKITMGASAGGRLSSGAMPNLGNSDDFLAVLVADSATPDSCTIGVSGNNNPSIALWDTLAALNEVQDDTGGDAFTTAIRDASTKVCGIYSDRGDTKFYYIEGDGSTITSPENIAIVNATGDIDMTTSADVGVNLGVGNIGYGVALFQFSYTPDPNDMLSIASWCNYQWRANNKVLPPWLKYRV